MKAGILTCAVNIAAMPRPVPTIRTELNASDWFPHVVSKICPIEWWFFAASVDDIHREDFVHQSSFELERQNTWLFPRFRFSLFRPKPEDVSHLRAVVSEFQGTAIWRYDAAGINAYSARPTFVAPLLSQSSVQEMIEQYRNPPKADPNFLTKAMSEIPALCQLIEDRLDLRHKPPQQFDPNCLTKEGLASSRDMFEDFYEPGEWGAVLVRDAAAYPRQGPLPGDVELHFSLDPSEQGEIFHELAADWDRNLALIDFPLLSRIDDITSDVVITPSELGDFLAECLEAQTRVHSPQAIRGLDKLIRMAHRAMKLKLSIYLVGQ